MSRVLQIKAFASALVMAALLGVGCGGSGGGASTGGSTATQPSPVVSPPSPIVSNPPVAAPTGGGRYDMGEPTITTFYVANNGNDTNSGLTTDSPLRTVTAAWQKVPRGVLTSTGYRILLAPGTYPRASLPNYMDARHGSRAFPIIITALQAGTVTLSGDLNVFDVRYLYLINLNITPQPAGDALHCEQCQYLLVRDSVLSGGARVAQETIKINQSQNIYLEGNDISGAWDNAIDYVGVQYGHVLGNRIHNAGDWCQYAKGGSAYLRMEGNTYTNCGTGGFTAGQGTGFQFMTSPWLHYEAYDIRFINNIVHNVEGAAIGAQGAFNVLFAHNTFYRIGSRSHLFEAVAGLRSCDGSPGNAGRERCQQFLTAGGWGTTVVDNGSNAVRIPNRNVLVLNNIFYNPTGSQSQWQQFQIFGTLTNPADSGVPAGSRSDAGLILRGNLIWNGPSNHPLGIEGSDASGPCPASHATCTEALLRAQNSINAMEPQLVNAAAGDWRPQPGGNVTTFSIAAIPNFAWTELPTTPAVPPGGTDNRVNSNLLGESRASVSRVGAY